MELNYCGGGRLLHITTKKHLTNMKNKPIPACTVIIPEVIPEVIVPKKIVKKDLKKFFKKLLYQQLMLEYYIFCLSLIFPFTLMTVLKL